MLCALAGGVGAARLLAGIVDVVDPRTVTAIGNVADDTVLHGLHISPDLDTVTYTLAHAHDADRGWGLQGETWQALESLRKYDPERGWFALGDRDLGTHLFRTGRLAEGAALSTVTAEITSAWGLSLRLLPVTDDRLRTHVVLAETGAEVPFQQWFVGQQHRPAVRSVRFEGAETARPAPGVLEAITEAELVIICPSNPIVSIGPMLALPEVAAALESRRDASVAVSPIIAGRALKGPADRLLVDLGHEPNVVGVARLYAQYAATLVMDEADADMAAQVSEAGMEPVVAPTIMSGRAEAAALATTVLDARARRTATD